MIDVFRVDQKSGIVVDKIMSSRFQKGAENGWKALTIGNQIPWLKHWKPQASIMNIRNNSKLQTDNQQTDKINIDGQTEIPQLPDIQAARPTTVPRHAQETEPVQPAKKLQLKETLRAGTQRRVLPAKLYHQL